MSVARNSTPDRDPSAKTTPASARGEIDKALATIRYRQQVAQRRLPDADRWIAQAKR